MIDLLDSPLLKLIIFGALVANILSIVGLCRLMGRSPDELRDHAVPILLGAGALYMMETMLLRYWHRDAEGIRAWASPLEWVILAVLVIATFGTLFLQ